MMKITSKENKPIKSFKSTYYNKIVIISLYIITLFSCCLLITTKKLDMNLIILSVFMIIGLFLYFYWLFNFEFEIYNTYFTVCFNFIFLPYKIMVGEIKFDNIDWIDGEKFRGANGSSSAITFLIIKYYLKNGKVKKQTFLGKEDEFYNIIHNWKNIAKYETP